MWPFKSKYNKLKREDVIDAIYKLEKQEEIVEDSLLDKQEEIGYLLKKGREEKSYDVRMFYAKKINHLKEESQQEIRKGMYLLYNIRLLKKLKDAIDDKEFFVQTSKMSLGNLLQDQKGLAKFLNEALNTKISAEDILTSADETFNDIQSAYEPNKEIYGVNHSDDELLAVFEDEENVVQENPNVEQNLQSENADILDDKI